MSAKSKTEDAIRLPAAQTHLDLSSVPVHLAWMETALIARM